MICYNPLDKQWEGRDGIIAVPFGIYGAFRTHINALLYPPSSRESAQVQSCRLGSPFPGLWKGGSGR